MPVRSLSSSVFKWPSRLEVDRAIRLWAERVGQQRPEVFRVGYFGSYARDNAGVGSDLDVVILVAASGEPFARRAASWDFSPLPIPVEALVYTENEWKRLNPSIRFHRMLTEETVWVYQRGVPPNLLADRDPGQQDDADGFA
jgi:predicted nucleotidyltransferase